LTLKRGECYPGGQFLSACSRSKLGSEKFHWEAQK
jgi:hypothetical protein